MLGVAMLTFSYLMTWFDENQPLATKCNFLLVLLVTGVVARLLWWLVFRESLRGDLHFSSGRMVITAISAGLLVATASRLWVVVKAGMSAEFLAGASINVQRAFYVLAAVSEESFFCWAVLLGGLVLLGNRQLVLLEKLPLPGWPIALFGTSILFAVWHAAVYGTGAMLQMMFFYRLLFGFSYIASEWFWGEKYLGIAMLAHATINYLATGGGMG